MSPQLGAVIYYVGRTLQVVAMFIGGWLLVRTQGRKN